MSTSSPAIRNWGSKPPIASAPALRKAMLQPGMCSASRSETSTWIGPPGALATQSATAPSSGGGMLGPPTPTCVVLTKVAARWRSQCGSGCASSSM